MIFLERCWVGNGGESGALKIEEEVVVVLETVLVYMIEVTIDGMLKFQPAVKVYIVVFTIQAELINS